MHLIAEFMGGILFIALSVLALAVPFLPFYYLGKKINKEKQAIANFKNKGDLLLYQAHLQNFPQWEKSWKRNARVYAVIIFAISISSFQFVVVYDKEILKGFRDAARSIEY